MIENGVEPHSPRTGFREQALEVPIVEHVYVLGIVVRLRWYRNDHEAARDADRFPYLSLIHI